MACMYCGGCVTHRCQACRSWRRNRAPPSSQLVQKVPEEESSPMRSAIKTGNILLTSYSLHKTFDWHANSPWHYKHSAESTAKSYWHRWQCKQGRAKPRARLCNRIYIIRLCFHTVLGLNYVKTAFWSSPSTTTMPAKKVWKRKRKRWPNARLATVIPKDERLIKTSLNI